MNTVAIGLAILVLVLLYVLYYFFMLKSITLMKTANLNTTNAGIKIVNSPTSSRYAYGLWVYVNSWDTSINKVIFAREKNMSLRFDNSAPILKLDIKMTNGMPKTMEITDNFPLQKWVYVVVSVDNQYVDAYIDGKLIKSGRMFDGKTSPFAVPNTPGNDDIILGGGTRFDAYISNFKHWSEPVDPQIVWNEYMEGNGQSSVSSILSSYGISLAVSKDNVEQSKYKLL